MIDEFKAETQKLSSEFCSEGRYNVARMGRYLRDCNINNVKQLMTLFLHIQVDDSNLYSETVTRLT